MTRDSRGKPSGHVDSTIGSRIDQISGLRQLGVMCRPSNQRMLTQSAVRGVASSSPPCAPELTVAGALLDMGEVDAGPRGTKLTPMKHAISVPALLLLGCSATTEQGLAQRSATAWQCKASSIEVTKISAHTYRTTGCGREADYTCPIEGDSAGGSRCEMVSGE